MAKKVKKLRRSQDDKILAGVAGGMAEYLGVDPVWLRLIWAFLLLPGGLPGILPYIVCWIVIPHEKA